jgi:peptide deformylase
MAGYDPIAEMELERKRRVIDVDQKRQAARDLFEREMRARIPSKYRDRKVIPLVFYPDVRLTKPCESVESFGAEFRDLTADMLFTMYMCGGVGLAAPQVGVNKRLFVADWGQTRGEPIIMANPVIVSSESTTRMTEACLSFPGVRLQVSRPERVIICYNDDRGNVVNSTFDGWPARVAQHEIDHLNGVLMVTRVGRMERRLALKSATKIERGERPVAKPKRRR